VRYSGIQLDTYGYSWIQRDTVDLLQNGLIQIDTRIHGDGDTEDTVRYRRDTGTGEIQAGYPKNTRQLEGCSPSKSTLVGGRGCSGPSGPAGGHRRLQLFR